MGPSLIRLIIYIIRRYCYVLLRSNEKCDMIINNSRTHWFYVWFYILMTMTLVINNSLCDNKMS